MVIQKLTQWGFIWIRKSLQGVNDMDIEPIIEIFRMRDERDLSQVIIGLTENLCETEISGVRVEMHS